MKKVTPISIVTLLLFLITSHIQANSKKFVHLSNNSISVLEEGSNAATLQENGWLEAIPIPESPIQSDAFYQTSLFYGSVNYTYPITIPHGTNALQPKLNIKYNSGSAGGRAGIVGLGWDLTRSYVARDVEYTPDSLGDDKYRLVLNGQSFELVYLPATGRYHTKDESHLHIEFITTGAPNNYGGYWLVKDKSGTSYRFGYSAAAEETCRNRAYATHWHLEEVIDTNNNHIFYSYRENPFPTDRGAVYLDKIEYNNDRSRAVDFFYEASDRPDKPTVYQQGCEVRYARRLSSIQTKANGSLVRQYDLSYSNGGAANKSLLTSITERGTDGTPLPPTTFDYHPENNTWDSANSLWLRNGPQLQDPFVTVADANGDGYPDIVTERNADWSVHLNTGQSWLATPQLWLNSDTLDMENPKVRLMDVTGDGKPDIVSRFTGEGWRVFVNKGDHWDSNYQTWLDRGPDLDGDHVRFGDVNGDGLLDIAQERGTVWKVFLNTGSRWEDKGQWLDSYFELDDGYKNGVLQYDGRVTISDVNGDGLGDIVRRSSSEDWRVFLSTGTSWDSNFQMWYNDGPFLVDRNVTLGDVNSDGLPDIIEERSRSWWVYPNMGDKWDVAVEWLPRGPNLDDFDLTLADANGDSYLDMVNRESDWFVYSNHSHATELLSTIHTSLGGQISIDYRPSTHYTNTGADSLTDIAFPLWVVEEVVQDNGLTGSQRSVQTTTYEYRNGFYAYDEREFRGFSEVLETDTEGNTILHYFHQEESRLGREHKTVLRDSAGNLYSRTFNTYTATPKGLGFVVELTRSEQHTHDGQAENPRITAVEYTYDDYGNITRTANLGDVNQSGDERYDYSEFAPNTALWIVSKPIHTYRHGSDDVTKIRESWFLYDGQLSYLSPPTKGNLTKQEDWLETAENPITIHVYDEHGNVIRTTDPNGHTTEYSFGVGDSTFTYPDKIINAKLQETSYSYDLGTGHLLSEIDPNGYTTHYEYDAFGRISKEIRPYDDSSFPTISYLYLTDGTAPEGVRVSQRTSSGQSATLDVYSFTDGFGRTVQSRTPAENPAQQIVTNTFYDNRGLFSQQSVPHLAAFNSGYTVPLSGIRTTTTSYDPLERPIRIQNPDTTIRTTDYHHWQETDTNENGNVTSRTLNAYGNIIRVEEHNQGEIYTTSYVYNAADELLSITDNVGNVFAWHYDTLGRQIEQDDPDLGLWHYGYDAVGNQISQTDSRGITTITDYDVLNRVTKIDYPTLTDTVYVYDVGTIGAISSVTDAAGSIVYGYDQRLRPIEETRFIDALTWTTMTTYDAADRVTSITYPDGETVTYTFNGQGQIESVSNLITNYDYNAFNKIMKKSFNNGITTQFVYASDHFRLQTITTPGLQDLDYVYDAVGNVIAIKNQRLGTQEIFAYDDLDRLVTAQEAGGYSYNYEYNAIGNILHVSSETDEMLYSYGDNAGPHAVTAVETALIAVLEATPLQYDPNPLAGEPTTVQLIVTNISSTPLNLSRLLVGVHGPNCAAWPCNDKVVDFPVQENITLLPNETYTYEAERAYNDPGDGYLMQASWADNQGNWHSLSPVLPLRVSPGIELQEPLTLAPATPFAGQLVTANYTIRNVADKAITLPQIGVVARGPNCTDWICNGWADFPSVTNVILEPNESYSYSGTRPFTQSGQGYFADAAFADNNVWWYTLPGNKRYEFEVTRGLEMVGDVVFMPETAVAGQTVTAQFSLQNFSQQVLALELVGMGMHGPDCESWDCDNLSDFPWAENVIIQPGQTFDYVGKRIFHIPNPDYIAQAHTRITGGIWQAYGAQMDFPVAPGIETETLLMLTPEDPDVDQQVTASYTIHNLSDQTIILPQIGIIGRGPDCNDWDCDNNVDFPPVANVTIPPGESYTYTGFRSFSERGDYFADVAYADENGRWYKAYGEGHIEFSVSLVAYEMFLPVIIR